MIKSRRMTWAAHVAGMGKNRNSGRVLVRNPKGKRPLDVGGRIILKWILEK
jgi:hypothetical protein